MENSCLTTGKVCATINDGCHKIVMSNKMVENVLEVNGEMPDSPSSYIEVLSSSLKKNSTL